MRKLFHGCWSFQTPSAIPRRRSPGVALAIARSRAVRLGRKLKCTSTLSPSQVVDPIWKGALCAPSVQCVYYRCLQLEIVSSFRCSVSVRTVGEARTAGTAVLEVFSSYGSAYSGGFAGSPRVVRRRTKYLTSQTAGLALEGREERRGGGRFLGSVAKLGPALRFEFEMRCH
ncbi:hypothetical protein IWZ00DRAFT_25888 [Phyllosticta capitalensis]